MTAVSWYGYTAEVDEQTTKDYYAQAPDWDCICGHCRNFVALARARKLPAEILEILDELHIPPEKATYVCELCYGEDWREKGLLYEVSWRVAGTVVKQPESRENEGTPWGPPSWLRSCWLMLGHETCPVAKDFPQPHFDLDISLYLPWMLDEPIEGPNKEN